MANKRVDSLKAKQKKQKILAAVLGVVFLGVVAFEGPKLWKQLHPPASQANVSWNERTTTTTGTPSLAESRGRSAVLVQPLRQQGPVRAAAKRQPHRFHLFLGNALGRLRLEAQLGP